MRYTPETIEAGGKPLGRFATVYQYGASLLAAGFFALEITTVKYELGDVMVIDAFEGHPHGHMAIFTGTNWVSDLIQKDIYPGRSYRKHRPGFTVYRHTN